MSLFSAFQLLWSVTDVFLHVYSRPKLHLEVSRKRYKFTDIYELIITPTTNKTQAHPNLEHLFYKLIHRDFAYVPHWHRC